MRKLLFLLLTLVSVAGAQVSITGSSVTDATLHTLQLARVCMTPVDAAMSPVGFRIGSSQVMPSEVCGTVTLGVLASFSVAPNPEGVNYHVYVKASNSNNIIRDLGMVHITGSSWSLDSYDPNMAILPVTDIRVGTVTNLPTGSAPTATITPGSPAQLNLGIPQGLVGPQGDTGPQGPVGATGAQGVQGISGLGSDPNCATDSNGHLNCITVAANKKFQAADGTTFDTAPVTPGIGTLFQKTMLHIVGDSAYALQQNIIQGMASRARMPGDPLYGRRFYTMSTMTCSSGVVTINGVDNSDGALTTNSWLQPINWAVGPLAINITMQLTSAPVGPNVTLTTNAGYSNGGNACPGTGTISNGEFWASTFDRAGNPVQGVIRLNPNNGQTLTDVLGTCTPSATVPHPIGCLPTPAAGTVLYEMQQDVAAGWKVAYDMKIGQNELRQDIATTQQLVALYQQALDRVTTLFPSIPLFIEGWQVPVQSHVGGTQRIFPVSVTATSGGISAGTNTATLSACPMSIYTGYGDTMAQINSGGMAQVILDSAGTPETVSLSGISISNTGVCSITFTNTSSHSSGYQVVATEARMAQQDGTAGEQALMLMTGYKPNLAPPFDTQRRISGVVAELSDDVAGLTQHCYNDDLHFGFECQYKQGQELAEDFASVINKITPDFRLRQKDAELLATGQIYDHKTPIDKGHSATTGAIKRNLVSITGTASCTWSSGATSMACGTVTGTVTIGQTISSLAGLPNPVITGISGGTVSFYPASTLAETGQAVSFVTPYWGNKSLLWAADPTECSDPTRYKQIAAGKLIGTGTTYVFINFPLSVSNQSVIAAHDNILVPGVGCFAPSGFFTTIASNGGYTQLIYSAQTFPLPAKNAISPVYVMRDMIPDPALAPLYANTPHGNNPFTESTGGNTYWRGGHFIAADTTGWTFRLDAKENLYASESSIISNAASLQLVVGLGNGLQASICGSGTLSIVGNDLRCSDLSGRDYTSWLTASGTFVGAVAPDARFGYITAKSVAAPVNTLTSPTAAWTTTIPAGYSGETITNAGTLGGAGLKKLTSSSSNTVSVALQQIAAGGTSDFPFQYDVTNVSRFMMQHTGNTLLQTLIAATSGANKNSPVSYVGGNCWRSSDSTSQAYEAGLFMNFAGSNATLTAQLGGNGPTVCGLTQQADFSAFGPLKVGGLVSSDGTTGMTGTCASTTTLTIKNGLIVGCS